MRYFNISFFDLKWSRGFLIIIYAFSACMPQSKSTYEHGELMISLDDSVFKVIESAFEKRQISGSFILHDLERDSSLIYNPQRANDAFLPASTFKITNSLIALECKAVHDENEVIPWDGVIRSVHSWNTDQTMRTAIRYSAVWFYQELARRIGAERMNDWLIRLNYGNRVAGPGLDNFWLSGDLRITPMQQVDFLKRMVRQELPVKNKNLNVVKEIMIVESNNRYVLRAKTGWATAGPQIGWYVGWLEIDGKNYIFVNNIDIANEGDEKYRIEIVMEVLDEVFQLNPVLE
jgi:beta-lactamase class D